jgi:hypothetical protein
MNIVRVTL